MAGIIDDIFASMNAATGDNVTLDGSSDLDTSTDDTGAEQNNEGAETPVLDNTKALPEEQTDDTSIEGVDAGSQQQKPTNAKPQQQKKPEAKPKTDAKGNLIDDKGNIIATAGVQRRLHETNQRLTQLVTHKDQQIAQLTQQVQEARILNELPQRLGINNQEVEGALQIAYAFKQNPVEAARIVVAEALQRGHNLDEILGEQQAGQLQMTAVRQMLNEHLGPIQAERQQRLEQQRIEQESQAAFNQFLVNYPDAEANLQTLAELMAKDPHKGSPYEVAERAYLRLSDYCRRNGFDISRPLAEQINNPAPAQANQQRNGQAQQRRTNAPLPSPNAGRTAHNPNVASTPVSANSSWREIINSVRQDLARGS